MFTSREEIINKLQQNLHKAQEMMKEYTATNRKDIQFNEGDGYM